MALAMDCGPTRRGVLRAGLGFVDSRQINWCPAGVLVYSTDYWRRALSLYTFYCFGYIYFLQIVSGAGVEHLFFSKILGLWR